MDHCTNAVQVTFEVRDGKLLLSNFTNQLTKPARQYLGEKDAVEPLEAGAGALNERFIVMPVWGKVLPGPQHHRPGSGSAAAQGAERRDDRLCRRPARRLCGDQIDWVTKVDYGDGDSYVSTQDPDVKQGPIWFYYVIVPGSGSMELIDSVEYAENVNRSSASRATRAVSVRPA